jgi:hypothetical protein
MDTLPLQERSPRNIPLQNRSFPAYLARISHHVSARVAGDPGAITSILSARVFINNSSDAEFPAMQRSSALLRTPFPGLVTWVTNPPSR